MDELHYKPDARVVRTARAFIRSLCEVYGHNQGMTVWDQIREVLGDRAASDIFLGMLTGDHHSLMFTGAGHYKIEAIKEIRSFTGLGLKDAKDLVDEVSMGRAKEINVEEIPEDRVQSFVNAMRRIGCTIE